MNTIKAKIESDENGTLFFRFSGTKHFLKNIDKKGYDFTCFTNAGYFGGFRVKRIEHDINSWAILEVL